MLLVIDVGNTTTELGVFQGEELIGNWRMMTKTKRTSDEFGIVIESFLLYRKINPENIKNVVIASVVPNIMYSLKNAIYKYFEIEPMIVGPGIKTGISIRTDDPREVGADRIIDIVAAYNIYGGPALVIDFGTATTFDFVTENGVFNAAITSPGIQISADALWNKAAKLPNIEIKKPESILAKNTITSMQAGLVYGYIGQVEYIINKVKEETGINEMKVIATGGYAKILFNETDEIDIYDPQLALKGLKLIYEKNI